ncbi:MAG: SMP-30/gluconolactonase/LRE family protein [Isosphaeraceae bacterium]
MHARTVVAVVVGLVLASTAFCHAQEKASGPIGTIERLKPALDRLIPPGAQMEKLAGGFDWSEGPVWMPEQKALLFSDVPMNTVFRWKEGEGVSVFLKPSGYTGESPRGGEPGSNGLTRDPKGALVLMQHGDRRVARLKADKTFEVLADRHEGKRFNSPNDGVFKSNGDFYFTDPPYGLLKLNEDPAKEIPYNGVYRLGKDGKVTLLTREMTFPNGLAFSPDEKTLYVANSDPKKAIWMAYPVKDDGTLGNGRVFFDATSLVGPEKKGLPDGMKVDKEGNLFATGPGGVLIFAPDGTQLGVLNTGEATANCAWGEDGSTLFITADMYLCRLRTTTKGPGY